MLLWQRRLKVFTNKLRFYLFVTFFALSRSMTFLCYHVKRILRLDALFKMIFKKMNAKICIMIKILINIGIRMIWYSKISITVSKYFDLLSYAKNTRYKISLSCKKIDYYTYEKLWAFISRWKHRLGIVKLISYSVECKSSQHYKFG